MGRGPRVSYPGAYLHVMNHATHTMPLFQRNEDYSLFIKYLRDKSPVYGIKPIAYCLMPNHYHLLLLTTSGEISRFMQTIESSYARMRNKKAGTKGPVYQGRFISIIVDEHSYLLEVSRYIHLNPVRAGIVKFPEEYRWSSIKAYLYPSKYRWIFTEEVLSYLRGSPIRYLKFLHEGIDKGKAKVPIVEFSGYRFYGGKSFARRAFSKFERRNKEAESGERKYRRLLKGKIRYNIVIDIVLEYFGKGGLEEIDKRDYKSTNIREILAYFLYRYTLLTTSEISEILGYAHRSAITLASKRIQAKMRNDDTIRKAVLTITDTITGRVVNL